MSYAFKCCKPSTQIQWKRSGTEYFPTYIKGKVDDIKPLEKDSSFN